MLTYRKDIDPTWLLMLLSYCEIKMSTRRVDLNRQRKIYPYIRRKPVYGRMDINENIEDGILAEIETAELSWNFLW